MKLIVVLNFFLYAILLIAFLNDGAQFDLARHGIDFAFQVVIMAIAYYAALAIYLVKHQRNGRLLIDPYNMFLFLFSILIVPGVVSTGAILGSHTAHIVFLLSGVIFVAIGLLFETVSAGTTSRSYNVTFKQELPNKTALTFLFFYTFLVGLVFVSGNINRAGAFNQIISLVFLIEGINVGSIANYRTEIYQSWGIQQVIGNYAGGIFGPFFALILFTYFRSLGTKTCSVIPVVISLAIIAFPLVFAVGSGSRLILLRTLLIYSAYAVLPLGGVRLLGKEVLQVGLLVFALLVVSTSLLGRGVQGETFTENLVIQTEKSIARVLLGKGGSTMTVYDYYPKVESFELGLPILERLSGIELDGEPSIAVKMFGYLTNGLLGTAGPQTFGDFYASFGYIGQLVLVPLLAVAILSFRILYIRKPDKDILDRALWAFLNVSVGYIGYSDLGAFKANGFVYLFVVYLGLRLMSFVSRRT